MNIIGKSPVLRRFNAVGDSEEETNEVDGIKDEFRIYFYRR